MALESGISPYKNFNGKNLSFSHSLLTVQFRFQIFKDEWTWSSTTRQILPDPYLKFPTGNDAYTLPTVSSSVPIKDNDLIPTKVPYNTTPEPKKPTTSFASIPLPPSLSTGKSQQDFSIDMTSDLVHKQSLKDGLTTYNLQSVTSTNKYNRELTINPLFTGRTDGVKSYRS